METHQYQPLDDCQIRLLLLLPGQFPDPLTCKLVYRNLSAEAGKVPRFEALSYTWGDQSNPTCISIIDPPPSGDISNQLQPARTISIGQNLASALRHLRLPDRVRTLWCDSACINQADLAERASQVLLMGDIYRLASRVVIWLGPEEDDSSLAILAMMMTGNGVRIDFATHTMMLSPDAHGSGPAGLTLYEGRHWRAVAKLLARSWFKRLWIRQEIIQSTGKALVVCGSACMPWGFFAAAVISYRTGRAASLWRGGQEDRDTFEENMINAAMLAHMTYGSTPKDVGCVLDFTRRCACTDERDRVYAVLGLCSFSGRLAIRPDYTLTPKMVYRQLVERYFAAYGTLRILSVCDMATQPSWVPDLNSRATRNDALDGWATDCAEVTFKKLDGERARVSGVYCDTIVECHPPVPFTPSLEAIKGAALEILRMSASKSGNESDVRRNRTELIRVFLAHCEVEKWQHPDWVSLAEAVAVFESWLRVDELRSASQPTITERKVLHTLTCTLAGRSIHRTKTGAVILGPAQAQSGDLIYAVLGVSVPLVLRPVKSGNLAKGHRIIGPCHHPAYGQREALLGPLPPGWRCIHMNVAKTTQFESWYVEGASGRKTRDDPRLGPLPEGWKQAVNTDENAFLRGLYWYRDGMEAPKDLLRKDPRLSVDALKMRGIRVESVLLV